VIKRGFYNYAKSTDGQKQYSLFLCWLPKAPVVTQPKPAELTPTLWKKASMVTSKQEQEVKLEDEQDVKDEPGQYSPAFSLTLVVTTLPKRLRTASSDVSTPPRTKKKSGKQSGKGKGKSIVKTRH